MVKALDKEIYSYSGRKTGIEGFPVWRAVGFNPAGELFTVVRGSVMAIQSTKMSKRNKAIWEALQAQGVVAPVLCNEEGVVIQKHNVTQPNGLEFARDHVFDNAAQAASVISAGCISQHAWMLE